MEQDVAEFVGEGLHLGRVVHVHPDRDLTGEEVGDPVGTANRRGGRDQPKLKAARGDLVREAVPEPCWRLTLKQIGAGEFGDGVAGGLGDVPDVGGLEAYELRLHDFTRRRPFAAGEAMPRGSIGGVPGGEPCGDGSEDAVATLALLHVAAEREPLVEAGDVRRRRVGHAAFAVRGVMLGVDQHRVVEAARTELRSEGQRPLPVLAAHESCDRR